MKNLPLQPSSEMIRAGIAELNESGLMSIYIDDEADDMYEQVEDAVVFIWQAMLSNLK